MQTPCNEAPKHPNDMYVFICNAINWIKNLIMRVRIRSQLKQEYLTLLWLKSELQRNLQNILGEQVRIVIIEPIHEVRNSNGQLPKDQLLLEDSEFNKVLKKISRLEARAENFRTRLVQVIKRIESLEHSFGFKSSSRNTLVLG